MEDSKIVLVDLQYLYDNYTDELRDQINSYHDDGDDILIGFSYYWMKNILKSFELTAIKDWLELKGIKYHQLLINYHVQTLYVPKQQWGLTADINIPDSN